MISTATGVFCCGVRNYDSLHPSAAAGAHVGNISSMLKSIADDHAELQRRKVEAEQEAEAALARDDDASYHEDWGLGGSSLRKAISSFWLLCRYHDTPRDEATLKRDGARGWAASRNRTTFAESRKTERRTGRLEEHAGRASFGVPQCHPGRCDERAGQANGETWARQRGRERQGKLHCVAKIATGVAFPKLTSHRQD